MPDPIFDEKDYSIGGRTCHYAHMEGDESLPPIVFLHGITTFGHYFDETVKHLNLHNSIYLMDLRGHGKSDPGEGLYKINSYLEDIHFFLQFIICKPVHVVGHSLGGRIGIALSATQPELVASLAIIDVAPSVDQRGFARLFNAITKMPRPFRNLDHVYEFFTTTWGGAQDLFIELMVKYGMITHSDGTISPRFDPPIFSLPPEVLISEIQELWECCAKISLPTLIARGENSDVLSPEIAERLQKAIPGARVSLIKGASHSVPADAPVQLAEVLNGFIPWAEQKSL
ncbi:MAG: alpha/beta fold hydrolase [bacterium]